MFCFILEGYGEERKQNRKKAIQITSTINRDSCAMQFQIQNSECMIFYDLTAACRLSSHLQRHAANEDMGVHTTISVNGGLPGHHPPSGENTRLKKGLKGYEKWLNYSV